MAKKSKEKQKQESQTNDSNIFNTLFGETPIDSSISSLFSDNNPFRRKSNDDGVPEASIQNQTDGVSENSTTEIKKRKKKDKDVILTSPEEVNEETNGVVSDSKRKKKDKKVILDFEANEDEGSNLKRVALSRVEETNGDLLFDSERKRKDKEVILGSEVNEELNEGFSRGENLGSELKKKQKKRKRDEIEAEYEAKLYGVVAVEKGVGEMVVGEKRKKIDNPEDMMVSKEGFDDESKLLRTVFVANLPLKIKKKVLMKEFGSFGEVESVRIRSVPVADSATPRKAAINQKKLNDNADSVHAYIVFKSEESAQASLAHNMAVVEGRHIRVDRACPPRKKMKGDSNALYDNKRTIFVGNLPFDVKDEEIYQLFSGIKELESSTEAVRVIRDPNTHLGKGFAYVLFKTREVANFVARKRNLKLRDRNLRVFHSKANSTPSKRSNEDRISSPAKRLAVNPGSSSKGKATTTGISYQGMKASKSGVQKKTQSRMSDRGKPKPKRETSKKPKERKAKRPSVAARKAKALKAASSGLKPNGMKRKLENRTPDSAGRKKKFRKS